MKRVFADRAPMSHNAMSPKRIQDELRGLRQAVVQTQHCIAARSKFLRQAILIFHPAHERLGATERPVELNDGAQARKPLSRCLFCSVAPELECALGAKYLAREIRALDRRELNVSTLDRLEDVSARGAHHRPGRLPQARRDDAKTLLTPRNSDLEESLQ
jgi:hypothetical protein